MLVWNPASLGIENQWTKCVKMFRSNCIDFSPTTTIYYAYSTIKAPDKGEVGGSSPPRPTIKSPINTRLFSLLPSRGRAPKNRFAKNLPKVRGVIRALGHGGYRVPIQRLGAIRPISDIITTRSFWRRFANSSPVSLSGMPNLRNTGLSPLRTTFVRVRGFRPSRDGNSSPLTLGFHV